jgi:hypothetical protein
MAGNNKFAILPSFGTNGAHRWLSLLKRPFTFRQPLFASVEDFWLCKPLLNRFKKFFFIIGLHPVIEYCEGSFSASVPMCIIIVASPPSSTITVGTKVVAKIEGTFGTPPVFGQRSHPSMQKRAHRQQQLQQQHDLELKRYCN